MPSTITNQSLVQPLNRSSQCSLEGHAVRDRGNVPSTEPGNESLRSLTLDELHSVVGGSIVHAAG